MSRVLHAFTSYEVKEDMGDYEINYENDADYDIAVGNWHYIYTILQYAEHLIGIDIPRYDYLEDAYEVRKNGMVLTDINLFISGLEAVIKHINQLNKNENHLIDACNWYLYDADERRYGTLDKQKDEIILYSEKLLEWAKQGLHFVEEKS